MAELRRAPPGRAGRLWLLRRIQTARRGIDLLDRKLRILRAEQQRCHLLIERTRIRWHAAAATADQWLLRAALLGGQRELRLGVPREPVEVEIEWAAVMGVSYPATATCRWPASGGGERGPGTRALAEAAAAHRAAVQAAAAHAVAEAAGRAIDAEVAQVRRRLTAIADRWLPRLEALLRELEERLEESERAETIRSRWAVRQVGVEGDP